ncbi:hypothetical protein JQ038_16685 [Clostridium botulinum]|nr:hypothetical protein [Clostridium botulinum]
MSSLYKFYLKMHIGAPSVPCVKEGEFVERGQVIAEPNGLGLEFIAVYLVRFSR